jgi:Carboxypeptidase regulatory-like domain
MKSCANYLLRISGCIVLTAILAATAQAASLAGTVTYGTGGVPSAVVNVYHTGTGRKAVTLTNSRGAYSFNNIPGGKYIVLVEKDGRRIYQGRVDVPEQATRFDIRL